jgi:hypothetical protein
MALGLRLALVLTFLAATTAQAAPDIRIDDVALFYQLYDSTAGHPTADQIQQDYIDKGSDGLRRFLSERRTTAARIAQSLTDQPQIFQNARKCLAVLPAVKTRAGMVLAKLATLYPAAQFPPVTIAVGRGKPVAIADRTGVMIGLESLCSIPWMTANIEDRFTYVIAHEYVHVQQAFASPDLYDKDKPTVLEASLLEGSAEFLGILLAGDTSYAYLPSLTRGHEKEIETAFTTEYDETDTAHWLYNSTMEKPADLGYWVGRRIAQSYYDHASDKSGAVSDIIHIQDAHRFLDKSGWSPSARD